MGKHDTTDPDEDKVEGTTDEPETDIESKDTDDPDTDGPDDEADDDDEAESEDEDAPEDESEEQSTKAALFWSEVEIDPVEIALPSGVGLTLRHYRTVEDEEGDEVEEAIFLAHKGKLQLFRSAEGLVDFLNSDAPHDLAALDSWPKVVDKITVSDIVPAEDDHYELDLVVENLRGGHDSWDPELLIAAGEVARDIAFGCKLSDVLSALAPGSPLDDMDEALRKGGFMARRRLRKVGAEQAAIGWRSIVGKISAAVTWHD